MKRESVDIKYITVSEKDTEWGITLTTAGFQQIEPQTTYPPAIHPSGYYFNPEKGRVLQEYQLIYVTHGEGKFRSENVRLAHIKAGTMFMLFPGEWHSYRPDKNSGWTEYWIGFTGEYIDNLVKKGFFSPEDPIYDVGLQDSMVEMFVKIIEQAKNERIGFQPLIAGAATYILGQIYSIHRNIKFDNVEIENQINRARIIMRENLHNMVKPENVAAELNMGYSWFRRMFKQYTGLAPAQYLMQLKIQRAKDLLIGTSLTIKEIAFQLNFNSHFHFSNFFREKTNLSPSEFRSLYLGKTKLLTDTFSDTKDKAV